MIIELRHASKRFGHFTAVDAVSAKIDKGEILGFVGANGAGKTTTINMLLGFLRVRHGEVLLFGEAVQPPTAHRQHRRIGYAASDMQLPARLTGRQYLTFVQHRYGTDMTKRIDQLTKCFKPELDKTIAMLSRGNKQKLALIAAFAPQPQLVILDEPTSGLDPVMQEQFLSLIREERKRGTTVFMSSHYLAEVVDVCTRVMLMRNGAIIKDIPTSALLAESGKRVRVVSADARNTPIRGAVDVRHDQQADGTTILSFSWHGDVAALQPWVAGLVGVQDLEISEYDMSAAFHDMYSDEGQS